MMGFDPGAVVLVCACGVVGDVGDDWWNWRRSRIRICLGSEEGVDAMQAGSKKEVHCVGS